MDYAEARAAFFQPREAGAPLPGSAGWQSPARSLRDAIEPIATICFWAEPAYDSYARQGLDFLGGYVWGRGCVLGEPEGTVVASSFGVFEPGLIVTLYDAARAVCGLEDVRTAKEAGAVESLHDVLGKPDETPWVLDVLRRGVAAADPYGRPLHAGLSAMPWPGDELGQVWHACSILREHRGDGHVDTCASAGLSGLEANLVTEMQVGWEPFAYTASRGWSQEAMEEGVARLGRRGLVADGQLTGGGRRLREEIEQTTDQLMQPVVEAIGDDLPRLVDTLDGWSQQIVERGWFPPDPYKRASG